MFQMLDPGVVPSPEPAVEEAEEFIFARTSTHVGNPLGVSAARLRAWERWALTEATVPGLRT